MADLRVLLNSYHSGANAWFALGEARGHFAEAGVNVEFEPGSGAYRATETLIDGGFDLAFGDLCALIAHAARSPGPAAIYAIHHRSPSAVAVVADGSVHAPRDLEGRRLITHLSDVAYRSFPAYACLAGIDPDRVTTRLSDAPMAAMLQDMLAGGADGVFGYISSQRAVLRQIDPALAERLRFLPFPDVAPDLYGSVVIASPVALRSKGEPLRAFLRGLNRSLIEAVADPEAAVAAVLERNPALDSAVETDRWMETIADEMTHPKIETLGFGAIDPARLGRSIALLAETLPLPNAPAASAVFSDAFLPPLQDRLALSAAILRR